MLYLSGLKFRVRNDPNGSSFNTFNPPHYFDNSILFAMGPLMFMEKSSYSWPVKKTYEKKVNWVRSA